MGKTGKWLRNFLIGKKEKETISNKENEKCITNQPTTPIANPPTTPKEKRRWSFRRSSASPKDPNSSEIGVSTTPLPPVSNTPAAMQAMVDGEYEQNKYALVVEEAKTVAFDAAINGGANDTEAAAAIKIQSVFRSYLARKALSALRGLVKLQALVRGHLVRKQATATLRCMQALVMVQARARAQRMRMADDQVKSSNTRQSTPQRKSTQDMWNSQNDNDRGSEDNVKIVEMDFGVSRGSTKGRKSYSNNPQYEQQADYRYSPHYGPKHANSAREDNQISPAPSAMTDMSPRICSGHFEDYSFNTAHSSPQYHSAMSKPDPSRVPFSFNRPEYAESMSYEYPFFPSYMANTESSRAKVRSQSAPKQRPESYERQLSNRRKPSMEGRNIPKAVKMQRSSSQVGTAVQGYQYPWSIKLDKSSVSLMDSECGSTSTVLTNINYCKSLVSYNTQGRQY